MEDEGPKYINSKESKIFHKGRALYGLNESARFLRQKGMAIIVEGYTDFLSLWQSGLKNSAAVLGTALTSGHARLLSRYVQSVTLIFDGDEAGLKAAARSLPLLLSEGLEVKAAALPEKQDPDEFVRQRGGAALEALALKSQDLFFQILQRRRREQKAAGAKAIDLLEEMALLIQTVKRESLRAVYKQRVLDIFGSDAPAMRQILDKRLRPAGAARRARGYQGRGGASWSPAKAASQTAAQAAAPQERASEQQTADRKPPAKQAGKKEAAAERAAAEEAAAGGAAAKGAAAKAAAAERAAAEEAAAKGAAAERAAAEEAAAGGAAAERAAAEGAAAKAAAAEEGAAPAAEEAPKISLSSCLRPERLLLALCLDSRKFLDDFLEKDGFSCLKTLAISEIFRKVEKKYRQNPDNFDKIPHLIVNQVSDSRLLFKDSYPVLAETAAADSRRKIFNDCLSFLRSRQKRSEAGEVIAGMKMSGGEEDMKSLEKVFQLTKQSLQGRKRDLKGGAS